MIGSNTGGRSQIRISLQEFERLLILEFNPSEEELIQISEKLDYLSKAVDRLNRFDWKGLALGTFIGISTNLAIDTESGRKVFELLRQAFDAIVKLLS